MTVISEDLARKLGGRTVLGQRLEFPSGSPLEKTQQFEIVGVAPVIAPTSVKESVMRCGFPSMMTVRNLRFWCGQ